jgi:UDP-N-acetylglucosamine 2-epimerase (non-hydrolysing)/GDP/UDP-N,N'-diacetylbacillosamine 2-epimerase (hydrolysing)
MTPDHFSVCAASNRARSARIAVITTSRADYSHLYWVLKELSRQPEVELAIITMGPHLSSEFGSTWKDVADDGFTAVENIECLLSSDTDVGMAKTIGVATLGLADCLGKLRPDLLLLIADRYEMLAPASVALALRIPVAHIEGGDVSLGAIDEAVRNALTKLSHIHLTTTETARQRVIAMGEEPWRVHVVGSPSLDHLTKQPLLTKEEIERRLNLSLDHDTIAVIYHPVTIARDTLLEVNELLAALDRISHPLLFINPNADAGSRELTDRIHDFIKTRSNARFITSIEHLTYLSLLHHVSALVGNSSSGIMEAASFKLPVVNVGMRQAGRERARNVLDVPAERTQIENAITVARSDAFRQSLNDLVNPYGDGHAAEKIVRVLTTVPLSETLLAKPPVPIHPVESYEYSAG